MPPSGHSLAATARPHFLHNQPAYATPRHPGARCNTFSPCDIVAARPFGPLGVYTCNPGCSIGTSCSSWSVRAHKP